MKKKVLYIHHGGSQGGAPRSLSFLIEKIDRNIYDPYVLCVSDKSNIDLFERTGAKVIFDDSLGPFHGSTVSPMTIKQVCNNLLYVAPTYTGIQKHIKQIEPDIVHLNSTCLFIAAMGIKKINKNIPIVCHVREPLLNNIFGQILKIYNNKFVDRFISIDEFDATRIDTGRKKIDIVYNFVDFKQYNTHVYSDFLRKTFSLSNDDIIFLYLARIAPSNGALEMVNVIKSKLMKYSKLHFVIVGFKEDSKYSKKVKSICDSIENVHTLPFSSNVTEMIASSDVMVCPFIQPHFARAIIEAGAMGIPSIASDIGGPKELIIHKKTGLLFNVSNFEGFYNCCIELADNENARKEMGWNAEKFAKEKFDADKNSAQVFSIYKELE